MKDREGPFKAPDIIPGISDKNLIHLVSFLALTLT